MVPLLIACLVVGSGVSVAAVLSVSDYKGGLILTATQSEGQENIRPPLSYAIFTLANDSETLNTLHQFNSTQDRMKAIGDQYLIQTIRTKPPFMLFDLFRFEKKIMLVQSLDNLTKAISLADNYQNVKVILYDFETWNKTPQGELASIPSSVNKGAEIVHKAGYKFGVIPDSTLLLNNYKFIDWTKVDFVGLQLQKYTQSPGKYAILTDEVSRHVKSMNPQIRVFAQLSFRFGSADDMSQLVYDLKSSVDGFIISYRTANAPNSDDASNQSNLCFAKCDAQDLGKVLRTIVQN